VAQGRLSLLLALEVAPIGRATADRHGVARVDPADEHGESALGRGGWRRLDERIDGLCGEIAAIAAGRRRVLQRPRLRRMAGPCTGDRTILGKISKRGNRYLRVLFVQAA
jgi:hypothetical protein